MKIRGSYGSLGNQVMDDLGNLTGIVEIQKTCW